MHKSGGNYECRECQERFPTQEMLSVHAREEVKQKDGHPCGHRKVNIHKCRSCKSYFFQKAKLILHKRECHPREFQEPLELDSWLKT